MVPVQVLMSIRKLLSYPTRTHTLIAPARCARIWDALPQRVTSPTINLPVHWLESFVRSTRNPVMKPRTFPFQPASVHRCRFSALESANLSNMTRSSRVFSPSLVESHRDPGPVTFSGPKAAANHNWRFRRRYNDDGGYKDGSSPL
jgi:hypothetical protein